MTIQAFQYDPTLQLRHKRNPRLKEHRITPDKAQAQAQTLVKKLGITYGTMLDGKIVAIHGTQTFTLEPYYFGIPLDTPDGADISLLPADTVTNAPKGWLPRKLVSEGTLYLAPLAGYYGNGQWMIKGTAPTWEPDRTKQIDDMLAQIIALKPLLSKTCPWSNLSTSEIDGILYTQAGPQTLLDPKYVKFIEQNTTGRLTYKFIAGPSPVFVYADGTLAALIMPMNYDKMGKISNTAPHKPARKGTN